MVHTYAPVSKFQVNPKNDRGWIILSDFDGTISLRDVTDALLERFGLPGCAELESEWASGHIGSRACLGGQIALLDVSKEELDSCLADIEIDPDFLHFVAMAEAADIEVRVVSDGLDYAIHSILNRHGLSHLSVLANRLVQTSPRRWRLDFPFANDDCRQASGHCKCASAQASSRFGKKVLFIGDGSSDFCASGKADFVLAKDRLIEHCQQQQIPHAPIGGFQDAVALLPHILNKTLVAVS